MPPDPDDPVEQALRIAQNIGTPDRPMYAGVKGGRSPVAPEADRYLTPSGLYSHAADLMRTAQPKGTWAQYRAWLLKNGVKPDELKWSGADETFGGRNSPVTREELKKHFDTRLPAIHERKYSDDDFDYADDTGPSGGPRYSEYAIPGGNNYRELVLHQPIKIKGPLYHEVRDKELYPALKALGKHPSNEDVLRRQILHRRGGIPSWTAFEDQHANEVRQALEKAGHGDVLKRYEQSFDSNADLDRQRRRAYKSPHWDPENVIAHVRMSDRNGPSTRYTDKKTEKLLHVEELQSDWAQNIRDAGEIDTAEIEAAEKHLAKMQAQYDALWRDLGHEPPDPNWSWARENSYLKNADLALHPNDKARLERLRQYRNEARGNLESLRHQDVPRNAPYVDSTAKWLDLVLKRVLVEAARGNHNKIVITPGDEHVRRYGLQHQIHEVEHYPYEKTHYDKPGENGVPPDDGQKRWVWHAYPDDRSGNPVEAGIHTYEEMKAKLGKEVADQIVAGEGERGEGNNFLPVDLQMGGEGQRAFYDQIVPRALEKLAKKHDPAAKVEVHSHRMAVPMSDRYMVVEQGPAFRVLDTSSDNYVGPVFKTEDEAWNHRVSMEGDHETRLHSLKVTPKMRSSIKRGLPAFASGGSVTPEDPPLEETTVRPLNDLGLYSHAAEVVRVLPQQKGTWQQFRAMLLKAGVKPDEIKWSGADEKFADPAGSNRPRQVTKDELSKHFDTHANKVREVMYAGEEIGGDDSPKYDSWVLPGGKSYREVLLTLPGKSQRGVKGIVHFDDDDKLDDFLSDVSSEGLEHLDYGAIEDETTGRRNRIEFNSLTPRDYGQISGIARKHNAGITIEHDATAPLYRSPHWEEPNVLAHIRMTDREERAYNKFKSKDPTLRVAMPSWDPNKTRKMLHVEEVQSDWGQHVRDQDNQPRVHTQIPGDWSVVQQTNPATGYTWWEVRRGHVVAGADVDREEAERKALVAINNSEKDKRAEVNAPYIDSTGKWLDLALKRVLKEAAHGDYHKIVITPGEEQNKRYGLEHHVKAITYAPKENMLILHPKGSGREVTYNAKPERLSEILGKETATKLLAKPLSGGFDDYEGHHHLNGVDLKVGGEGQRKFYDEIVPRALEKLAKKHDPAAKVQLHGPTIIETEKGWDELSDDERDDLMMEHIGRHNYPDKSEKVRLHSLEITPKMRASIKKGQTTFGGGGAVRYPRASGGPLSASDVQQIPDVSVASLGDAFTQALQHHLALPEDQRIANSKRAADVVAGKVGRYKPSPTGKQGQPLALLGKNMKLEKTEKGYKGGEPVMLPDGRAIEAAGLSLSPAYQHGKFTTCPNSASCKESCLGKTSGGNWMFGGGNDLEMMKGPRLAGLNRTLAMVEHPREFAVRLNDEIEARKRIAARNGTHLGVRLNVLSDLHPRIIRPIIEAHPDVTFYDYTKLNANPIAPNHHYTYSSTGLTQPKGLNNNPHDVVNPYGNWKSMRQRLDTGSNVAMAFSHKNHLPETVHDLETGRTYRVVDGDTHDFRPLDKQEQGRPGVIVGLRKKSMAVNYANATRNSKGFFVHYDPVTKNGVPTVKSVQVAPQPSRSGARTMIEDRWEPAGYKGPERPFARGGRIGNVRSNDPRKLDRDDYVEQFHHNDHYVDEPVPEWYEIGSRGYASGGVVRNDHGGLVTYDDAPIQRASGGRTSAQRYYIERDPEEAPTDAQKEAGNYAKRHISFQGMPISIENPKGSTRRGSGWSVVMPADYGYFKRTEGADGDQVDCYIGPDKGSPVAFIVNQLDHHTGKFDEHKVILGTRSERDARQLYCAGFSDGKGAARLGSMEPVSVEALKGWLKSRKTVKPARSSSIVEQALKIAAGVRA